VWIFTKQGFVSIKQHKDDPEKLLIRARIKGDLEKIFPGCKVTFGGGTDYRYRTTVDRKPAAVRIAEAVLAIDYTEGFKTSVDDHCRRAPFYLRIWEVLCDMQDALASRKVAASKPKPAAISWRKIEAEPRQQQVRRSPLQQDLVNRLYERLHVCCRDFMSVNEIAGISFSNAHAALLGSLARFLVKGISETTHLNPDEFGEVMADTLRQARSKKSQHQTH
jgi:hypothetical protein